MTNPLHYKTATFSIEADRCKRTTELVLSHANADSKMRILDIGCGTGGQIFQLAAALPNATFVGLDISPKSVQEATARREGSPHGNRMEFIAIPYLEAALGAFDIITSDNVLHLIEEDDSDLTSKLARELKPSGKLIYTMPYPCFFNSLLLQVRRLARRLRSPGLDALLLKGCVALYGKRYSIDFLKERIIYMYFLPHRFHDARMVRALQHNGLSLEEEMILPNESIGKLKHKAAVYSSASLSS